MRFRFYIALWVAKLCYRALRLIGRQASQQPGWLALAICPDFLSLAPKANLCIAVTGTNGKTTVANLLTDALELSGLKVVSNRAGANVDCGCATNLVNSLNYFGKCKVDATVFEVDERFSRITLPGIQPDYLLVTNFFRDSLKRNAHPDYIFSILDTYCPNHTHLILNADDLGSNQLKINQPRTYFGVGKLPMDQEAYESVVMDNSICPHCHSKLSYEYRHYHHIGKTYCPTCGYKSPEANVQVETINTDQNILQVRIEDKLYDFPLLSDVLFNVYNQTAVITMLHTLGWEVSKIQDIAQKMHLPTSRLNQDKVNGVIVTQAMSKGQSCISSCRTFDFVSNQPGKKVVILALDDYYDRKQSIEYWGWIYDVDYELLAKDDVKQVVALGPRCLDHKVRLLLAGVKEANIVTHEDEMAGCDLVQLDDVDKIFILYDTSTYQLSCQIKNKIINRLEEKA